MILAANEAAMMGALDRFICAKGVPEPILAMLRDAVLRAQEAPRVEKRFADIGGSVAPIEMRDIHTITLVASEVARRVEVIKKAGAIDTPK